MNTDDEDLRHALLQPADDLDPLRSAALTQRVMTDWQRRVPRPQSATQLQFAHVGGGAGTRRPGGRRTAAVILLALLTFSWLAWHFTPSREAGGVKSHDVDVLGQMSAGVL